MNQPKQRAQLFVFLANTQSIRSCRWTARKLLSITWGTETGLPIGWSNDVFFTILGFSLAGKWQVHFLQLLWCYTIWLANRFRATFSTNQRQSQNQLWCVHVRFPALRAGCFIYICYDFWLAFVIVCVRCDWSLKLWFRLKGCTLRRKNCFLALHIDHCEYDLQS